MWRKSTVFEVHAESHTRVSIASNELCVHSCKGNTTTAAAATAAIIWVLLDVRELENYRKGDFRSIHACARISQPVPLAQPIRLRRRKINKCKIASFITAIPTSSSTSCSTSSGHYPFHALSMTYLTERCGCITPSLSGVAA